MIRLEDLPNRNPVERLRAHNRVDPYWDGMWDNSRAFWVEVGDQRRRAEAGLLKRGLGWLDPPEGSPKDMLGSAFPSGRGCSGRSARVSGLACTLMWRTLLGEQVAALTGRTEWASGKPGPGRDLYRAGLVDVGAPATPGAWSRPLFRPNSNPPWPDALRRLTFDEQVGVSGGFPFRWGSQADRHNVLTTELALRAAELLPVSMVAGEHLCSLPRMFPPGSGVDVPQAAVNFAPDAMLVRRDGLRIMVELTASVGDLSRKLNRWAQVLASDARARRLLVLFVFAPHPDAPVRGDFERLREQVRAASYQWALDGVPERMFVASWQDWFPARHCATQAFRTLAADCPASVGVRGVAGSGWEARNVLDPFEVPGPDLEGPDALVENQRFLLGVPHWMRSDVREGELLDVWLAREGRVPFPFSPDTIRMRQGPKRPGSALADRLTTSPEQARAVKEEYRRQRARWRLGLADGTLSVEDVFRYASTSAGAHFRRLRLAELLGSQPGWTTSKARKVLARFRQLSGVGDVPDSDMTIGWLMNRRRGPQDRWRWWWYAVDGPETPWAGFPYLDAPRL